MKFLKGILKVLALVVLAVLLLVGGTVMALYSPWLQNSLRTKLVERINSTPGMSMTLDEFRLSFPLDLSLSGLCMAQNGDTLVAASQVDVSVSPLPLFKGIVEADVLEISGTRFRMGEPDSAMYMTVAVDRLKFNPASVRLSDMAIDIYDGHISGGTVSMAISPDTTQTAPSETEQAKMSIRLGKLALDDFTYKMCLLPTIDSLGATIHNGILHDGLIDLANQRVALSTLSAQLSASYIAPDSATVAATSVYIPSGTTTSVPWTIEIDSIALYDSHALYTTRGVIPQPGLDFGYIAVDSLNLTVKNFYNQATRLKLPLRLSGTERCGVRLNATGTFALDSATMYLDDFKITTATTELDVTAMMGMGNLMSDHTLPIRLNASGGIGIADMRDMFPAFLPYLLTFRPDYRIGLNAFVDGTPARLDIHRFGIDINRCVKVNAKGYVGNLADFNSMRGNISLDGHVIDINNIKNNLLDKSTADELNIPPMKLAGHVTMNNGSVNGNVKVMTGSGSIGLDGRWNSRGENYNASLDIADFPVGTFMPKLGAGNVSATAKVDGHGYDPFSTDMNVKAEIDVSSAEYAGYTYRDIKANASVSNGQAYINMLCDNPDTRLRLTAEGNLSGTTYNWTIKADGDDIDLYAIKQAADKSQLSFAISGSASITPSTKTIYGSLTVDSFDWHQPAKNISFNNVDMRLQSNDTTTSVSARNNDMTLFFESPHSIESLTTQFERVADMSNKQLAGHQIKVDSLQAIMPRFKLDLNAGANNVITDILASSKMGFKHMTISAVNDTTLKLGSQILSFQTGNTRLDSISFGARQYGETLDFDAAIDNRPGTFDQWAHVQLAGQLSNNGLNARLRQHNIEGREGFDLGLNATLADSTATLRFKPLNQTIGYKPWVINADNYISYNIPTKHIDANLVMSSGNSRLVIMTDHIEGSDSQEDLQIKLSNIHIADWVSINPFAPQMKGDVNADIRLRRVDEDINGVGNVGIDNFYYDRQRVASMKVDFDVTTKPSGMLYATSQVYVDGKQTMTLAGNLNDSTSTSPYNLDFSMIHFPLATVNPFLPKGVAKLKGSLNGSMRISGDADRPIMNGYLDFDSTSVNLGMTGTDYIFSDDSIPVVDNLVSFKNFNIKGVNDNPLTINGNVDISSIASPAIDLTLKADNMQLVNTRRASRGADIYGKAFISLDAKVHGNMELLFANADLRIVPPTNVTYVIPDASNAIASQSVGDMVRFVNFSDTTAVLVADTVSTGDMAMILDTSLTIENGTTIGVDLSTDGKNRAQIEADGTLYYTMSPISDGRMTGRLNINEGYVRYSPPLMSEKNFAFDNNSYIAFNGDIMNPTLNIHAVDVIKANVTQSGQNSRLVNFDVALNITGNLNRLDVAFDLSTDDDVTVANELQSMSPDQRANQAMNMLLYGIYTGQGTKGDASISGNALYSFLESQLNSWVANNIRGVDLSFGIDQYNRTVNGSSSQTTSYSYQVSKSLFDDRFKIVVGGNYSTDANADENFSQNLINDISFEYYLNKGHTMYIKIFRHTGYESILEGEITQTGVGFVYRRKLNNLKDMFRFLTPKKKNENNETK